jgi:hypothetical protein
MCNLILLIFSLTADELLNKVDTARAPKRSESLIQMRNYLSEDREITYKLKVITERKKATYLEILEPAREAGRKFLLIGNDIWMYVPEVGKPLRLSARDKFLGSEFSNSDLMESSYEKNFKASSIDSTGNYYLLEIQGKSREAPYKRITMKVRKSNFIPSELQYYTMSGRLFREMSMDSIKNFEGQPYATYLKMSNVLSPKSYTEVKILSFKSLKSISPALFKPENLSR